MTAGTPIIDKSNKEIVMAKKAKKADKKAPKKAK